MMFSFVDFFPSPFFGCKLICCSARSPHVGFCIVRQQQLRFPRVFSDTASAGNLRVVNPACSFKKAIDMMFFLELYSFVLIYDVPCCFSSIFMGRGTSCTSAHSTKKHQHSQHLEPYKIVQGVRLLSICQDYGVRQLSTPPWFLPFKAARDIKTTLQNKQFNKNINAIIANITDITDKVRALVFFV